METTRERLRDVETELEHASDRADAYRVERMPGERVTVRSARKTPGRDRIETVIRYLGYPEPIHVNPAWEVDDV